MFQPNHREFSSSTTARYLTIAPCLMWIEGATRTHAYAAGAIVEVRGFPSAVLSPLNGEAVHAKHCSIRRTLKYPCVSLDEVELITLSLGGKPNLPLDAAFEHIRGWLANPKPFGEPR